MSYLVQQPNTSTNNTNKYRVIDYEDWLAFCNGEKSTYLVYSNSDTYEDAQKQADEMNAVLTYMDESR